MSRATVLQNMTPVAIQVHFVTHIHIFGLWHYHALCLARAVDMKWTNNHNASFLMTGANQIAES
jgi:hypothetical protein